MALALRSGLWAGRMAYRAWPALRRGLSLYNRIPAPIRGGVGLASAARTGMALGRGIKRAATSAGGRAAKRRKYTIKTKIPATPKMIDGVVKIYKKWIRHSNAYAVKAKKLTALGQTSTYQVTGSNQFTNNTGRQVLTNLLSLMDRTARSSAPFTIANTDPNRKVLFKKINYRGLITNQSNAVCFIKLYFCTARQDTNNNPASTWQNLVNNQATDVSMETMFHAMPTDIPGFNETWYIDKVSTFHIPAGGVLDLKIKYKPNFYADDVNTGDAVATFSRGLSKYVLMVHHGPPINDVTTKTQVSLGYGQNLDLVSCTKYKYQAFQNPIVPNYDSTGDLITSYTVNPDVMLEDVDSAALGANA